MHLMSVKNIVYKKDLCEYSCIHLLPCVNSCVKSFP